MTTRETPPILDPNATDYVAVILDRGIRGANHDAELAATDVETLTEALAVAQKRLRDAVAARDQLAEELLAHDTRRAIERGEVT